MSIQIALLLASCLALIIGAIHSWFGEVKILQPLLAALAESNAAAQTRYMRVILRLAWHAVTLAWWGFGAIFAAIALAPPDQQIRFTLAIGAATFFLTGVAAFATTRGKHIGWPLFICTAALVAYTLF